MTCPLPPLECLFFVKQSIIRNISGTVGERERGMGMPSSIREAWMDRTSSSISRPSVLIPSPIEEKKIRDAAQCTREGVKAGAKAAAVACVVTAVPTLAACRVIPWAKANLNYTAQALIISAASIAAYFITADKTILECARRNAQYDKTA